MSERENNVYKAKLAEQAERYDGELKVLINSMYLPCKMKSKFLNAENSEKFQIFVLSNQFFPEIILNAWLTKHVCHYYCNNAFGR